MPSAGRTSMPTSAPEMPVTLIGAGGLLLRGIDHGDGVVADQGGDLGGIGGGGRQQQCGRGQRISNE